jgi:hypothetical protein
MLKEGSTQEARWSSLVSASKPGSNPEHNEGLRKLPEAFRLPKEQHNKKVGCYR